MMRRVVGRFLWLGRATSTVVGLAIVLALVMGVATSALGATGGNFILGKSNGASSVSKLAASIAGPALSLVNNSTDAAATALNLSVASGKAPLKVNAAAGTATNLSADKLDGKDSSEFLGKTEKAADSDTLDGQDSSAFLGATQKAADSAHADNADKVGGFSASQIPGNISAVGAFSGQISSIGGSSSSYVFAGPTATVTTTSDQKLVGAAEAPIALSSGGSQDFYYGLCYQPNAGGTINNFVGFGFSIGQITTTRTSWSAAASVAPGAGTWNVGFCVRNYNAAAINNNDYVNGWVQVINGSATPAAAVSNIQKR